MLNRNQGFIFFFLYGYSIDVMDYITSSNKVTHSSGSLLIDLGNSL